MTSSNKSVRFIQFLPGIAWFLFLLVLICLPGEDVPEEPGWLMIPDFDKVVHAGLFGGLVFWFSMPLRKLINRDEALNWLYKITIATIIWGITTEYIQKFFVEGRQFDLVDWAADSAGAIISFFVCRRYFILPKPLTTLNS